MLWCVPTLGQPGILYLTTTKICLVYWLISINVFLWSESCFYWIWLLEWTSSQQAQVKELEYLVTRTAVLYQSQWRLRKRDQGVPGPHPPLECVWKICGIPGWATNLPHKVQDLKHLLGDDTMMEEGMAILRQWEKFTLHQGTLYHCHTPARVLEEVMWFVVPMAHRVVAMNRCHKDAGHQGQWWTLSLL